MFAVRQEDFSDFEKWIWFLLLFAEVKLKEWKDYVLILHKGLKDFHTTEKVQNLERKLM
jgi:hypothetical protein